MRSPVWSTVSARVLDRMITWPEQLMRASLLVSGYRARPLPTSFGDLSLLEARGRGRLPLMLLHGFSAEGVHYAPLMRLLRPHVSRLLVPDLPAHGRSAPPLHPIQPGELRAEIVEAFDHAIDEPTVLYGNSLGGLVALYYALSRPERVRGLIVCSPAGAAMTDEELHDLVAMFRMRGYAEALEFVDRLFVRPTRLRRLIAWGVRRKFSDPDLQSLLEALRPGELLHPDELRTLSVPTLLIWGKQDRILPRSCLSFLRTHLPAHVLVEEPEGHSHTPYLEQPGAVAARILEFMRTLA